METFKIFNIYGLEKNNSYLSMFSEYKILKYCDFVDQIVTDRPLLIVGIKEAKKFYEINLNVNKIDENIYWCYSPEEYLSEFIKQFGNFIKKTHTIIRNGLKFKNINFFTDNFNDFDEIISFLNSEEIEIIYQNDKLLYCYNKKITYIINISEFEYFNKINYEKFSTFTKKYKYYNSQKINDFFYELFFNEDHFFIEKTIPYLISLK